MTTLICLVILEFLVIVYQWRKNRPKNRYEVRIELTGGSVSVVEVRDWNSPIGKVNMVTGVLHGPCPPPSIRHFIAAALDRGELSGEMSMNGITSKWQVVKNNGRSTNSTTVFPTRG